MFTKYWRYYTKGLQLFLYLMLVTVMFNFFIALQIFLYPILFRIDLKSIADLDSKTPEWIVHLNLLSQAITQISLFLLPALLFAYFLHPRPSIVLGLQKPKKTIQILLSVVLAIGAIPIFLSIDNLIRSSFDFGKTFKDMQALNDKMFKTYLQIDSLPEMLVVMLVMAIIPAIGEEFTFRGVMMRFAAKWKLPKWLVITIPAIIFALLHANPYGTLSIFCAGVMLALVYYWTGSLWCSIITHMLFNGFQVLLAYIGRNEGIVKQLIEGDTLPPSIVISGSLLFLIAFYGLYKTRTPLPIGWSDDFALKGAGNSENT